MKNTIVLKKVSLDINNKTILRDISFKVSPEKPLCKGIWDFLQKKNSAERKALHWVRSNDIIEPNDLILYNNEIYTSSLYSQSLILKKSL